MNYKTIIKTVTALCMGIAIVLSLCVVRADSGENAENVVNADGSLTLEYVKDGIILSGVDVSVYRTGEFKEDGTAELTGAFADYPVDFTVGAESASARARVRTATPAETLAGYAEADNIATDGAAQSGDDGKAFFDSLQTGIYLVTADSLAYEDGYYTFDPFFVFLPSQDDDGTLLYDVETVPKAIRYIEFPPEDEPEEYKVVKRWTGEDDAEKRPESVTIEILCDEEVYDTCILSEENDWCYEWTCEAGGEWTVVERDVDESYTVMVEETESGWTVTNHYEEEPEEPEEPGEPGDKLPQTGQPWRTVMLLAAAGMLLTAAGWVIQRKDEKNRKEQKQEDE